MAKALTNKCVVPPEPKLDCEGKCNLAKNKLAAHKKYIEYKEKEVK